jgi:folate-dependent phosphoribosylglycinamide formyltransferase PurN
MQHGLPARAFLKLRKAWAGSPCYGMRITIFTSNQPRHVALIERLASIADEVFAVQECNTIAPGEVVDFFRKSDVMRDYFSRVLTAEREAFGGARFLPTNVRSLPIKMGDLDRLSIDALCDALRSDVYVVFGASYIKSPLIDHLVERRALNIHMGVSPYYRGSSTNFWAMYDRRPEYVGATIHLLSRGLDSGPMLFHALPRAEEVEAFALGMQAVKAAHAALCERIADGSIFNLQPIAQDKSREVRYTRNADFTDAVAREYLDRLPTPQTIRQSLQQRRPEDFARPLFL